MVNMAGDRKERLAAAGSWALLGLVLLAFAAFLGVRAAVTFGILGDSGHIVASRCVEVGGSKSQQPIECEGYVVDGNERTSDRLVKVSLSSADEGDIIPVHHAPWGTYEVVDRSLKNQAGEGLVFTLLLAAAVGCSIRACTVLRRGQMSKN